MNPPIESFHAASRPKSNLKSTTVNDNDLGRAINRTSRSRGRLLIHGRRWLQLHAWRFRPALARLPHSHTAQVGDFIPLNWSASQQTPEAKVKQFEWLNSAGQLSAGHEREGRRYRPAILGAAVQARTRPRMAVEATVGGALA